MHKPKASKCVLTRRAVLLLAAALALTGCGLFKPSRKISVPQPLGPLVEADEPQMFAEINRLAAVNALDGRVDIQFLDNSFAECGIAEKYRTADGRIVTQRTGKIYLAINVPIIGTKIAEMSSNGERFWAAVYQGDTKYRRYVTGTNNATYQKLDGSARGASPDCNQEGKKREEAMQRATVSALSSLRPQHFTDALLVPPVSASSSKVYAVAETFEEEADPRPGAKKDSRVIRGYYILTEFEPQSANSARVVRRFWFDRVGQLRLARVQTYGERGQLITDVVYGAQAAFGEGGARRFPTQIELTRPQDHYSLRVIFQDPSAVKVDQPKQDEAFVLKNSQNLPVVDLDAKK
ncbi:MAG TPA: hypothetical protein VGP08_18040 [Pyrinomonadaceae bacterium]|nr:hypothetical protein [Pyrinomonadaceae bacterium]